MIIVTGAVMGTTETIDALTALCITHTHRSRAEPGCVSHDVFVDAENPLRLFFFERWADRAALEAHFALAASHDFVRTLRAAALAVEGPSVHEVAGHV